MAPWIYLPSFYSNEGDDHNELDVEQLVLKEHAATRMQAAWRRCAAMKQFDSSRTAAILLQRAARKSYWDAWYHFEKPLTTMPALVLERISGTKLEWHGKAGAEEEGPKKTGQKRTKLVEALVAAVLGLVFVLSLNGAAVTPRQTSKPPTLAWAGMPGSMARAPVKAPSVVLPGGATVTLLTGWVGSNATKHAPRDDPWAPRAYPVASGLRSRGAAISALLAPTIEHVASAVADAGVAFVEHLHALLQALVNRGKRLSASVLNLAARLGASLRNGIPVRGETEVH